MRTHVSLTPIPERTDLDLRAEEEAERIGTTPLLTIDLDRSPYSPTTVDASAWVRNALRTSSHADMHVITAPLENSSEYLSCILSNRCTSVGVCVCHCTTNHGTAPVLVQVFAFDTDAITTME